MAFLMFLLLLMFTILSYVFGGRKLYSPWFLLCIMFLATFTIVLINYLKWEVQINGKFVLYVSTAILSFGVGCALVQSIKNPTEIKYNRLNNINESKIVKTKYPVNLFLYISISFSCVYIFKLIFDAGISGSFTAILRRIYELQSVGDYSPGFIFNQLREVVVAIAYLNVFRLIIRMYANEDKISIIKLIVPLIIFFILIMVSTERNLFLRFAIYSVCMWIMIYSRKINGKNIKIILKVAIMFIVIVLLFFLLGVTKQYESSFFDQISIYSASGLNNFNIWIESFNGSLLYGQSTFTTFLDTLGTIFSWIGDVKVSGAVEQIDPFTNYVTAEGYHYFTNIYTALRPYVEDFGYFGVILFPLLIGIFYQWLYLKTQRRSYGLSLILYCMLIYPVIYFPILEQLFRRFHLGFIYEIVWISVLFYFVFVRKKRKVIAKQTVKLSGEIKEVEKI